MSEQASEELNTILDAILETPRHGEKASTTPIQAPCANPKCSNTFVEKLGKLYCSRNCQSAHLYHRAKATKEPTYRNCANPDCANQFTRDKKYCSTNCGKRHRNKLTKTEILRSCANTKCTNTFIIKPNKHYCSLECREEVNYGKSKTTSHKTPCNSTREPKFIPCGNSTCTNTFLERPGKAYCCRDCARQHLSLRRKKDVRNKLNHKTTEVRAKCANIECNNTFTKENPKKQYCSKRCSMRAYSRRHYVTMNNSEYAAGELVPCANTRCTNKFPKKGRQLYCSPKCRPPAASTKNPSVCKGGWKASREEEWRKFKDSGYQLSAAELAAYNNAKPYETTAIIYFLKREGIIVYIGTDQDGAGRVDRHKSEGAKIFDEVVYLVCPLADLEFLEHKYIFHFRPKYNKEWKRQFAFDSERRQPFAGNSLINESFDEVAEHEFNAINGHLITIKDNATSY